MKRLILALVCIFSLHTLSAQQKLTLSLAEAIEMGLTQNFDQQIIEISNLSSEEELEQAKRDRLPDLSALINQGVSNVGNTGNYSLNASATLWSGGVKMNAIRLAQLESEQANEQIIQAQNTLAISIINTYLVAVMNDELHKYQESVLNISQEQASLGESRFQAGDILESDYLLLKAQAASDANAYTNSRIDRENAIIELKNLLAIDNTVELNVINPNADLSVDSMPMPSLSELIEVTEAWLPDLKIAQTSIEIAQKNIDIAKGGLMPTLSINGSVGSNYNSTSNQAWSSQFSGNNVNSLSLSLNIPLWNKGKTRSDIKQMNYAAEQAEIQAKKTEFELRNSLEREYNNTLALELSTKAAQESFEAYKETFRVFSAQFTEGAITTTELLQQQNNYLSSLNNYVQSKYNYILSRKVLDVYMGAEIKL